MESMVAALGGAHRSERLVYCGLEDNDDHKDFLWKNVWSSPVNMGLGNLSSKPNTKKAFLSEYEMITKKTMLAIMICLPPPEPAAAAEDETAEAGEGRKDRKDGEEKTEKKEPQPIPIGFICLSKRESDAFSKWASIGIQIAEAYQNKGYGRESINWILDWAFTWAGMHRISIGTASFNERAAALYQSIGFKPEGVTREAVYMNRGWHDLIEFGMLESEWEELRGRTPERELPTRTK